MTKLNQTIEEPFRVVCIDASNLDDKIDASERLVEGYEYIVTNVFSNILGDGNEAYKLLDINPEPFKGYGTYRFRIILTKHSVN